MKLGNPVPHDGNHDEPWRGCSSKLLYLVNVKWVMNGKWMLFAHLAIASHDGTKNIKHLAAIDIKEA